MIHGICSMQIINRSYSPSNCLCPLRFLQISCMEWLKSFVRTNENDLANCSLSVIVFQQKKQSFWNTNTSSSERRVLDVDGSATFFWLLNFMSRPLVNLALQFLWTYCPTVAFHICVTFLAFLAFSIVATLTSVYLDVASSPKGFLQKTQIPSIFTKLTILILMTN
jgi:hypothetical protein